MEFNQKSKCLETEIRLFTDDLEAEIKNEHHISLHLGSIKQHPKTDSILFAYILKKFYLSTKGKGVQWHWVGYELQFDLVELYIESEPIDAVTKLDVSSLFLLNLFDDQKNILNFKSGDVKKSYLYSHSKRQQIIELGR